VRPQKKKILPRWPADKVERWALERLVPYARNARTHSDEQVEQVAASIREWGWTTPVLVGEDGGIIAGHCRVLAATKLGLAEVPVMIAAGWSEAQKRAYVLADNQLALNAGWNPELLKLELGELQGLGFDLGVIGFDAAQLAALSGNPGLTDPDEVPEPPADPVTRAGDLWVLGRHRLLCGDATNAGDVAKVLGGVRPHLMVTDPPYGVDYDPDWRSSLDQWNRATKVVKNDNRADWSEAWKLCLVDVAYVWSASLKHAVESSLERAGFQLRSHIIWCKPHFAISRGDYHWQHEPCVYAVRKAAQSHWQGDRTQSTIWQIANNTFQGGNRKEEDLGGGNHGTQKPVECMRRPIENNSAAGDAVYDPFVGSGTTIIAAEMTGRACYAIEIDPAYVDVCVARWQAFTGERATLDGHPFDDIAVQRRQETAA
jgi:DNA modification methylase